MSDEKFYDSEVKMEGWLYKWTNYIKGYQKRWFVLSNGQLTYYRSQSDVSNPRGYINLYEAVIHTENTYHFIVSNSGTQSFHLRTNSEVEKQQWVTALELAKAKAIHMMESEDEEDFEVVSVPSITDESSKIFTADLKDMNYYKDLLTSQISALNKSLQVIEQLENTNSDLVNKLMDIKEKAAYVHITANAVINARTDYLELARKQGKKLQKKLQNEHEQRLRLEEVLEQLAHQHSRFEEAAKKAANRRELTDSIYLDTEDTFYDAEGEADFIVNIPNNTNRRPARGISFEIDDNKTTNDSCKVGSKTEENQDVGGNYNQRQRKTSRVSSFNSSIEVYNEKTRSSFTGSGATIVPKKQRRTHVVEKPNFGLNIWAIIKNCIGKELTRVSLPLNFNEPLSMLQRLTEEFEYSDILDRAAQCSDNCEQLTHVAAFTISAYASTSNRTGKPFNPLLGETYECDRRDDLGWRSISEQVSHHPPIAAFYCEGKEWILWQEFTMSSKFRGRYLQIVPLGIAHLQFTNSGNHYTWQKVVTNVHNFIVGKLWVDHHGEMDIANHTTGDKCHLKYVPYSYFSRDKPRMVFGTISDKSNDVKWILSGQWDSKIEGAEVLGTKGSEKGKPVFDTSSYDVLWERQYSPEEYEKMYCFTQLAIELNEPEEGVAPTDSRNRPDQRFMEDALWDEASKEKNRLEEKQRAVRRQREEEAEKAAAEGRPYTAYDPVWFKKQKDSITGNLIHMYNGKYWESKEKQDWSMCPDIY